VTIVIIIIIDPHHHHPHYDRCNKAYSLNCDVVPVLVPEVAVASCLQRLQLALEALVPSVFEVERPQQSPVVEVVAVSLQLAVEALSDAVEATSDRLQLALEGEAGQRGW